MCGRFAMPWDPERLADRLGVDTDEVAGKVTPSYNIAPGATVAVIRRMPDGPARVSDVQRAHRIGGRQARVPRRRI